VNGTQVTLEKVVLKAGVTPQVVCIGKNIPVKGVCASEVVHIVVKHCNDRVQPREFSLPLKKYTFKGKLPKPITLQEKEGDCESIKMKATQLPVLVNNATTGQPQAPAKDPALTACSCTPGVMSPTGLM
jgi:hypothetical protein